MEFKDRLRALRKEKGMNQNFLASRINYGYTAIANYESGRNEPGIQTLIKLAEELEVSVDYLVGVSDIRNPYE